MTVASSGKKTPNSDIYRYYACSSKKHLRGECKCQTHIPLNIIEPVIFACLGYFLKDDIRNTSLDVDEEYQQKVSSELNCLKKSVQKLKSELNAQLDILTHFEGSVVVRQNIEARIREIGDAIEENGRKQDRYKDELKVLDVKDKVSTAKINSSLEDLYNLQANITLDEKREVLALAVDKIVIDCVKRVGKYRREMTLRIFAKDDFVAKIPPVEIKFFVNTHSGISEWKITSPFVLSSSLRKSAQYQPQKRHWIHEVFRWQKTMEQNGLSLRQYAKQTDLKRSMLSRRLNLLKSLSEEVLTYLLGLKLKSESEQYSFRALERLGKMPKEKQFGLIKKAERTS